MKTEESFDFEDLKQETIKGLSAGKPIKKEKDSFAPLLNQLLEAALEGEIESHLHDQQREQGNRRNGKSSKTFKTIDLSTPQDRAVLSHTLSPSDR